MELKVIDKWSYRYLSLARLNSSFSKDGTKIGAVIVRPDKTTAAHGFNGLPPGMNDDHLKDRAFKNLCVLHAEDNALLTCRDPDLAGYSMYLWGLHPCGNCASKIVMKGIKKVVYVPFYNLTASESWVASCDAARIVFQECRVETIEYSYEEFLEGAKLYD